MGYWMTVQGTIVTGKELLAMEFRDFLLTLKCYPPPTSRINAMVALSNFPYTTDSAAKNEASSLHVIMRCVMSFSTSHNDPPPPTAYAENPSPTGSEEYYRRR